MDDHEHGEEAAVEWDGAAPPVLTVDVNGNPEGGWDVATTVENFTFTDPASSEHRPGYGHTHVYVDGRLLTMAYEPVVHIASLEPGRHLIEVVLSRGDHLDYALNGEPIKVSTELVVEGEVAAADVVVQVTIVGDDITVVYPSGEEAERGDVVEIVVDADVHDEIHIHGYDIQRPVMPGMTVLARFVADIPGVFEVELENSGRVLFELVVR